MNFWPFIPLRKLAYFVVYQRAGRTFGIPFPLLNQYDSIQ